MKTPSFLKPTRAKVHWDEAAWPWQLVGLLVAIDFVGLAVARYAVGWTVNGDPRPGREASAALMAIAGPWAIATRLLLASTFAAWFLSRGSRWRAFGLAWSRVRPRFKEFGTCLAVILPLAAGLSLASILVLRGIGRGDLIAPPLRFGGPGEVASWIWVFVVALPVFEEFVYRGILHPALRNRIGVPQACLVGGAIFGLLHALYGIPADSLLAYALGGAALAWVYERTGSLFFPWLLHVATNLVAVWLSTHPGIYEALRR